MLSKILILTILSMISTDLTLRNSEETETTIKIEKCVERYYPSSQLCNVCGYKNEDTKNLSVRFWTCPQCNTEHDRDKNASINILNQGLKDLGLDKAV